MSSLNLKRVVSKIEQNGAFRYDSYFESVKQTKIGTKNKQTLVEISIVPRQCIL